MNMGGRVSTGSTGWWAAGTLVRLYVARWRVVTSCPAGAPIKPVVVPTGGQSVVEFRPNQRCERASTGQSRLALRIAVACIALSSRSD